MVSHGSFTLSTDGTQTLVTYRCEEDYTLVGEEILFCSSIGSWDNTQPVCGMFVKEVEAAYN